MRTPLFSLLALLAFGAARAERAPFSSLLEPYVENHTLAGAVVAVADRSGTVVIEPVGFSNLANKQPMKGDSLFWIASMTKPMTVAALMMLVDEGKVGLDDPVSKFIPAYADLMVETPEGLRKPVRPVLVRDVLSHTSGLPYALPIETPAFDIFTVEERVANYAKIALRSEPGMKYAYSNAGINTAGRIIEIVGGMPYAEFMQRRLFDPLGMTDTTFRPNAAQLERLATSYKADDAKTGLVPTVITQLTYPLDNGKRTPLPGGGLFSTAADVVKFCQMLDGGGVFKGRRILSEESVRAMTTRETPPGEGDYGFGLSVAQGHFGHAGSYKTDMNIYPASGLITVFLVQQDGPWPNDGDGMEPAFQAEAARLFGTLRN